MKRMRANRIGNSTHASRINSAKGRSSMAMANDIQTAYTRSASEDGASISPGGVRSLRVAVLEALGVSITSPAEPAATPTVA